MTTRTYARQRGRKVPSGPGSSPSALAPRRANLISRGTEPARDDDSAPDPITGGKSATSLERRLESDNVGPKQPISVAATLREVSRKRTLLDYFASTTASPASSPAQTSLSSPIRQASSPPLPPLSDLDASFLASDGEISPLETSRPKRRLFVRSSLRAAKPKAAIASDGLSGRTAPQLEQTVIALPGARAGRQSSSCVACGMPISLNPEDEKIHRRFCQTESGHLLAVDISAAPELGRLSVELATVATIPVRHGSSATLRRVAAQAVAKAATEIGTPDRFFGSDGVWGQPGTKVYLAMVDGLNQAGGQTRTGARRTRRKMGVAGCLVTEAVVRYGRVPLPATVDDEGNPDGFQAAIDIPVPTTKTECSLTAPKDGDVTGIKLVFVHPAHRRNGIGKRLLDAVAADNQDQGVVFSQMTVQGWKLATAWMRRKGADAVGVYDC